MQGEFTKIIFSFIKIRIIVIINFLSIASQQQLSESYYGCNQDKLSLYENSYLPTKFDRSCFDQV